MKVKKIMCVCLAAAVALGCAGCKKEKTAQQDITGMDVMQENTMPITEAPVTLSVWMENKAQGYVKNYGDMKAFQILKDKTGVGLKFQHPTGAATEQLNIVLASNEYPDVIYSGWMPSGAKQLKNGVCLQLNDYIGKLAPNVRKIFEQDPTYKEQLELVNGEIVMFPLLVDDQKFLCYDGYFIRKDWLDKVGMDVPENMDEWYQVLKAFKENDMNGNGQNDEVPFASLAYAFQEAFPSAYGISKYEYCYDPDTGTVTHAVLSPQFKEYLTRMQQWYSEGLINPNFLNTNGKEQDSLMLNDQVGALYCDNNNSMPKYMQLNPDLDLVAVPYPKTADGKRYYPAKWPKETMRGKGAMITKSCKNVVEAVRYFDYLYSEEASDLLNWGVEGETYTKAADGTKQFTDQILKNPEGKTPYEAICQYMTNTGFVGMIQYEAAAGLESDLSERVKKVKEQSVRYALDTDMSIALAGIKFTAEESEEKSSKESDIKSYVDEMVGKFILGVEPLSNFDAFIQRVKELGIEDVIRYYQKAYDRYHL